MENPSENGAAASSCAYSSDSNPCCHAGFQGNTALETDETTGVCSAHHPVSAVMWPSLPRKQDETALRKTNFTFFRLTPSDLAIFGASIIDSNDFRLSSRYQKEKQAS